MSYVPRHDDFNQAGLNLYNQSNQFQNLINPVTPRTTGFQQTTPALGFNQGSPQGGLSGLLGNLTGRQIAGGIGLGAGLIGLGSEIFGSQPNAAPSFTADDIDELIASQRQSGSRQIGSQLSRANVATAGNLASRGLGSSTITTGALQANQAAAQDAIAQLEAQLGLTRAQAEQFLAQLEAQQQAQQQASKQQFYGGLADIGGLLLSVPTGGGSVAASQGIKALL